MKNDEEAKQELRERGFLNVDEVLAKLDKSMAEGGSVDLGSFARYVEEEHPNRA